MPLTKLTLSVDNDVVLMARELSKKEGVSISNIFSRYIRARQYPKRKKTEETLSPLVREAVEIGRIAGLKLPPDFDEQDAVAEALMEKYGLKK